MRKPVCKLQPMWELARWHMWRVMGRTTFRHMPQSQITWVENKQGVSGIVPSTLIRDGRLDLLPVIVPCNKQIRDWSYLK